MKVQVSRNQVMNSYSAVIEVGYCDLQNLLAYEDAQFYTAGVYGWNANLFEVPGTNRIIVTGYHPFGNVAAYKVREYDQKARQLLYADPDFSRLGFFEKQQKLRELIEEWSDLCIIHNSYIKSTVASLKGNRKVKAADRKEYAENLWEDLYKRVGLQGVMKMWRDGVWDKEED